MALAVRIRRLFLIIVFWKINIFAPIDKEDEALLRLAQEEYDNKMSAKVKAWRKKQQESLQNIKAQLAAQHIDWSIA